MMAFDAAPDFTKEPDAIDTKRLFKTVLFCVICITALAGIADIVLASVWLHPTDLQKRAFDAMDFAWKAGIGAMVGLVGGKNT